MSRLKKFVTSAVTLVATFVLVIATIFMGQVPTVAADDITNQLVDSVTSNMDIASPGQTVTFHLHFSGKKQYPIKDGDTIHVDFPQASATGAGIRGIPHNQKLIYHNPNDPNDPDNGVDMGTITVTDTGVTVTFNQKAAGLKTVEGGDFSFTGKVVVEQGSGSTTTNTNPWPNAGNVNAPDIVVEPNAPSTSTGSGSSSGVGPNSPAIQPGSPQVIAAPGTIKKYGSIGNNGNINWQIHGQLNNSGTAVITDQAQNGQQFVPSSFKITFFAQLPDLSWMDDDPVYGLSGSNLPSISAVGSCTTTSNGFTLSLDGSKVAAELEMIAKLKNQDSLLNNGNFESIAYTITYQTKLPTDSSKVNNWVNDANQKNPDGSQTG